MGLAVSVGICVSVGEGVSEGVKVSVIVGVLLGVDVAVRVTAGRSMGPRVPSPNNSRKIHPPIYWSNTGLSCTGPICNHVASSLRAINVRHVPTFNGSPRTT